jgi:Flp pilus assembly protein CpaB
MTRWPHLRPREPDDGGGELTIQAATDGEAPKLRLRESPRPTPPTTPATKRLAQPLPALGVVLVVVALIGYWSVYTATTHRTAVLIATQTLPAGAVLGAGDVRSGELAGDSSVIAGLVPDSALREVVGQRLASGVSAGAPLARAALAVQAPAGAQMTLAVPALHALDGALQAGDRVTVLATFGAGSGQAHTRPIARGLQVLAVGAIPTSVDPTSATVPVTVALADPALASELALANNDGKLDLLREGAGGATAAIPKASEAGGP